MCNRLPNRSVTLDTRQHFASCLDARQHFASCLVCDDCWNHQIYFCVFRFLRASIFQIKDCQASLPTLANTLHHAWSGMITENIRYMCVCLVLGCKRLANQRLLSITSDTR